MRKILVWVVMIGILMFLADSAWTDVGQTLVDTGEAAIKAPFYLVKFVGGALKLAGEVVLLPLRPFS